MNNFVCFSAFLLLSLVFHCFAISLHPRQLRATSTSENCGKEGQPPCSINFQIPSSYFNETSNDSLNNFQIFQAPVSFNLYFDGKNRTKPAWPKIDVSSNQPQSKTSRKLGGSTRKDENVPSSPSGGKESLLSSAEVSSEGEKLAPTSFREMYAQLMILLEANKGIRERIDSLRRQIVTENGPMTGKPNSLVRKRFIGNT